jgi:8-oxo-dGTP diphosphatase
VKPDAIEVVAAIIVRDDGRILMTQRFDDAHLGGLWEFPGGKREDGETPEAALCRELREELRIEVSVGGEVLRVTHDYPARSGHPAKSVALSFHRAEIVAGEPEAIEVQAIRWVTPEELRQLDLPEADRPVVDLLSRGT